MGKRLLGVLAAVSAVVPLTFLAAGPAAAVDRNCYSGYFCVYRDKNLSQSNSMYRWVGADGAWYYDAALVHDNDSSWENLWSVSARVYDLQNYGGAVTLCVSPGWIVYYSNPANDRGASHKWNGTSC